MFLWSYAYLDNNNLGRQALVSVISLYSTIYCPTWRVLSLKKHSHYYFTTNTILLICSLYVLHEWFKGCMCFCSSTPLRSYKLRLKRSTLTRPFNPIFVLHKQQFCSFCYAEFGAEDMDTGADIDSTETKVNASNYIIKSHFLIRLENANTSVICV